MILETVRGELALDAEQVEMLIIRLQNIHKAMIRLKSFDSPKISSSSSPQTGSEEDLWTIQHRLRPIQQILHTLKFMNRLDEVLLISMKDLHHLIYASDADQSEVEHLISTSKISQ